LSTEVKGPFYLEWKGNLLVVRSKQPITGMVSWTVRSEQQAALFALPAMHMQEGMKLLLSTVGHDDVLVLPRGDV
jgi:hypothetical protein